MKLKLEATEIRYTISVQEIEKMVLAELGNPPNAKVTIGAKMRSVGYFRDEREVFDGIYVTVTQK